MVSRQDTEFGNQKVESGADPVTRLEFRSRIESDVYIADLDRRVANAGGKIAMRISGSNRRHPLP